jgi:hypothetical protein
MTTEGCPNCGYRLVTLREEHQLAGTRRIWLRWLQCPRCRHVALDDWSFTDSEQRNPRMVRDTRACSDRADPYDL